MCGGISKCTFFKGPRFWFLGLENMHLRIREEEKGGNSKYAGENLDSRELWK